LRLRDAFAWWRKFVRVDHKRGAVSAGVTQMTHGCR